jgi:Flp pilus assembly secretin CpaC
LESRLASADVHQPAGKRSVWLKMRRIVHALLWAALPVLLAGESAFGAEKVIGAPVFEPPTISEAPTPQAAVEDIRPSGPPISLGIGLGTLLHLSGPANTVFVANETIADVQVKNTAPEFIYVTAKKPGSTVLYAADSAGHLLLNKVLEVTPGAVTIIRRSTIDTGEVPPPAPSFPVIAAQPQATASPAPAPVSR